MRRSFIRTWALVGSLALVASACSESSAPFENSPGDPTVLFGALDPFNGTGACMGNDAYNSGITNGMNSPDGLVCNAKEIYLARATATHVCDDALGTNCVPIPVGTDIVCTTPTVFVRVDAEIGQNSTSIRNDLGAWINPLANQAKVGNTCRHYNLINDQFGVVDEDGDQCGDMEGTEVIIPLGVLEVACTPGPEGKVLIGSCLAWTQPGGDIECPVAGNPDGADGFRWGTVPPNKTKCNCEPFELNIFVPGTVTIEKVSIGGDATFSYTSATLGNFDITTLGGSESEVFVGVAHGAHSVTETLPVLPWEFVSLECTALGDGTSVVVNEATRTANFTIASGGNVHCTYTNRKRAEITIKKITDPAENPAEGSFEFSQDIDGTGNFSLGHNGTKTFSNIVPGVEKTVTELAPTGYELVDITCTGADTWSGNTTTRVLSVTPDAGEEILCTFKNEALGQLIVTKETIGYPPGTLFDFTVKGLGALDGVNLGSFASFSLGDGGEKDSGVILKAGTYQVCELDATAGNSVSAELDGVGVGLYNPDAPGDDLGTRCHDVAIAKGQSRQIDFLNEAPPGGEARTIGYWRNWSSCTGGNQYAKAGAKGMATLDGNLPQTVGILLVDTCDKGVKILSKRDLGGQNRANDAAYNLASQLLAYYLNISAGAGTCSAASDAAAAGQALLVSIGFNGTGQYLRPQNGANYTNANNYAAILDSYNNNTLCP